MTSYSSVPPTVSTTETPIMLQAPSDQAALIISAIERQNVDIELGGLPGNATSAVSDEQTGISMMSGAGVVSGTNVENIAVTVPSGSSAIVGEDSRGISVPTQYSTITTTTTTSSLSTTHPPLPNEPGSPEHHASLRLQRQLTNDERITQRLRTFFSFITCLIIPNAITLGGVLIWMLISARRDRDKECDSPLLAYAYLSLGVFLYSPHHKSAKKLIFGYDRLRDGPRRPRAVVIFDRTYQLFFIIYVFLGVHWTTSCKTCQETAPSIYLSALVFSIVLVTLLFLLLLPLLCVPCIFVWLMRQGFLFAEPPSKGCAPDVIEKMEVVNFGDEVFDDEVNPRECCICMGEFTGEETIVRTTCKHIFHKDCVGSWLKSKQLCPLCRENLNGVNNDPLTTTTTRVTTTTTTTSTVSTDVNAGAQNTEDLIV